MVQQVGKHLESSAWRSHIAINFLHPKKEEIKSEKASSRITELEQMNDNVNLLDDMLSQYNSAAVNQSEAETMKVNEVLTLLFGS